MKYLIILFLFLNLALIASSKEKKSDQKKEESKSELVNKPKVQDVDALKMRNSIINDSLQITKLRVSNLSESLKGSNFRISAVEERLKGKSENPNLFSIVFFIVGLFIILIIAIVFYFLYAQLKNKINHIELRINSSKSSISQENKELNKVQYEFNIIKQDFIQIQNAIDKIQREKKNIIQEENLLSVINPPIVISESKEVKNEQIFMSTPNEDGSFNQSNSSQIFKPTASFYTFIINNTNNTKANFYFVDDERAVATASDFPQTYIDPVCEAVNAVNNHAKRIVTLHQGIVEKSGDKWVLIKKATIRYE